MIARMDLRFLTGVLSIRQRSLIGNKISFHYRNYVDNYKSSRTRSQRTSSDGSGHFNIDPPINARKPVGLKNRSVLNALI